MNEFFVPAELCPQRIVQGENSQRPFTGGPKPDALIIACSDANLDRTLLRYFEDLPVFLLRTFGNEVSDFLRAPEELVEALEEAVCWWRVPRIVVCGHSHCRGVEKPSLTEEHFTDTPSASLTEFQSMVKRVGEANRILAKAKRHTLEQLNVLRGYPFIENAIQEGNLQLSPLFYLHNSGLFLGYDEAKDDFFPLS